MSHDRRWSKFWWEDYEGDPLLSACSLAAQGLWMRMLCLMHRGRPYGHLVINGKPPSTRVLASIFRCSERELGKLLRELEEHEVFSRLENDTIFSRRMVRDFERSEEGREAIAKRWGSKGSGGNGHRDPNRSPTKEPTDHPSSEPVGDQLHLEARSKKQEAREDSEASPLPSAPATEPLPSARDRLWRDGLPIVQHLTGKPSSACRSLLGKMLRDARDDAPRVLLVLQQAQDLQPADPVAWLSRAILPSAQPSESPKIRNGFLAMIAADGFAERDEAERSGLLRLSNARH